jgi:hypothetical protein
LKSGSQDEALPVRSARRVRTARCLGRTLHVAQAEPGGRLNGLGGAEPPEDSNPLLPGPVDLADGAETIDRHVFRGSLGRHMVDILWIDMRNACS